MEEDIIIIVFLYVQQVRLGKIDSGLYRQPCQTRQDKYGEALEASW